MRSAWQGLTWEVDVFEGDNAGLIVAEIELDHETRHLQPPHWIGAEITGQSRYYNSNLVRHPFRLWRPQDYTHTPHYPIHLISP